MLMAVKDCTTQVEDLKLLYANDYMRFVSSGMTGLGASPVSWPPGPRPEPYSWTDHNGTTWTLVLLDGKWMYRDGVHNLYVSASNLYDMMGITKDTDGKPPEGAAVPGISHADKEALSKPPKKKGFDLTKLQLGGLGAGWLIVLGVGGYYAYKAAKRKLKRHG